MEFTIKKRFTISKSMYGKGLIINIDEQGFYYDHDEAFDLALESDNDEDRTHNVDRATTYTSTKGYPKFAELAVINY